MKTRLFRFVTWAALVSAGCLILSCGGSPAPEAGAAPPAAAEEPFELAKVFPAGPAREKVLNSCGSCHSVLCVARGQRTAERWQSVKTSHADKMAGAGAAQLEEMFSYLAANFNDTRPEPRIPPELMQQGCTPF